MKGTERMKRDQNVFQRIEKKYILTDEQYRLFLERISPYMELDQYGYHTICNIYYDTEHDELIRHSIEGPRYKEKLRLRTYGSALPDQEAFIEIKKKYEKVVYKRRESLPCREAVRYLNHGIKPKKESQILKEIDYFLQFYHPVPKLFLAYDREAFYGKKDPDFRMTVDHHIRYRENDLDLTAGDHGILYFKNDEKILEIKVTEAFPMWLVKILSDLNIYSNSFSKYGSIFIHTHLKTESGPEKNTYPLASGGI